LLGPLFLLIASVAQAQPFVSEEVIWRTPSPAATFLMARQAARVEADGNGFVVSWSEVSDGVSRAYAGRLDARGRLERVGVGTAGTADSVAIAPLGDRYIAAWREPSSLGQNILVTAALDREFRVISARPVPASGLPAPVIVRTSGARAFVGSGNFLYEVDRDGAPIRVYDLPRSLDDLAVAGDDVGYVLHSFTRTPKFCGFFRCSEPFDTYDLSFTWLYHSTSAMSTRLAGDAPSAVGTNGSTFLVVWFEAHVVQAAFLGSSFAQPFTISSRGVTTPDPLEQPQIAWDGARWLVVWSTTSGIEAAAVTPNLSITAFRLSPRGYRPAVAAAKDGRFVVTYEDYGFEGRRLASRIVDFAPPGDRERAVR
jgi:hypothetical protein